MLIASYLGATEQALAPAAEQSTDGVFARRGAITTTTEDAVRATAENLIARRVPVPAPPAVALLFMLIL